MKKYERYKDSGVQWLGSVPEHWEIMRFKHFMELITEPAKDGKKIGLENIESGTSTYIETESEFEGSGIAFMQNDIVYGKLRPYLRKVWQAEFNGNAVGDFFVFRNKKNSIAKYLKYLLLSEGFTSIATGSTEGAKMPRVSSQFILSLDYALPTINEQESIADYLDSQVSKINSVITEKEKMINDMEKYRSSLISETVTKGLDPNAPMKDSGVDWIGEIPKHWKVLKLKRLARIQTGSTPSTEKREYWNSADVEWFTPGDFSDNSIVLQTSSRKISTKAKEICRLFYGNTVLLVAIGATLGKVGYYPFECSANQQINAISFDNAINPKYGAYFLFASKGYMQSLANSATLPILNQTTTGDLPMLLTNIKEQEQISSFLDEQTSKIDSLISELRSQIENLKSYKQSLITEAVTGQVDVRDWTPNE